MYIYNKKDNKFLPVYYIIISDITSIQKNQYLKTFINIHISYDYKCLKYLYPRGSHKYAWFFSFYFGSTPLCLL
jgi:hypothetical protein